MASVKKFTKGEVFNQIRHIERTVENPGNPDIDKTKIGQCYTISPDRGMSAYDYFKKRCAECKIHNRPDVVHAFGWVISCPMDVSKELEDLFFYNVYDFLVEKYGEQNLIQCAIHKDESGASHMHFLAMPVVKGKDKQGNEIEKFDCSKVLTKAALRNFHGDLQKYIKNNGCPGTVQTGITKNIGGNREVKELKKLREQGVTIDKKNLTMGQKSRWNGDRSDRTERTW